MAALMHDVIEDSEINRSGLSELFGSSVADMVDGVSKLSKIFANACSTWRSPLHRAAHDVFPRYSIMRLSTGA